MSEILRKRALREVYGNTRINWTNVSYVDIGPSVIAKHYTVTFYWKYKNSLKPKEILFGERNETETIDKFFTSYGFFRIDDTFININRILYFEEETLYQAEEKSKLDFYFDDGTVLRKVIPASSWSTIKTGNIVSGNL